MGLFNLEPFYLISIVITLIISLSFHEFSHAYIAYRFGDDTARLNGRLTLNPLKHLDIMGSLMMVFVGFGWAKPVPVNPYALLKRSPAGMFWVALAGPASNFLLALVAAIPLRIALANITALPTGIMLNLLQFLLIFISANLGLMLFNLLPIAPLDGETIAVYLLPPNLGRVVQQIAPYGSIVLLVIMFVLPQLGVDVLGTLMYPARENLLYMLLGDTLL